MTISSPRHWTVNSGACSAAGDSGGEDEAGAAVSAGGSGAEFTTGMLVVGATAPGASVSSGFAFTVKDGSSQPARSRRDKNAKVSPVKKERSGRADKVMVDRVVRRMGG